MPDCIRLPSIAPWTAAIPFFSRRCFPLLFLALSLSLHTRCFGPASLVPPLFLSLSLSLSFFRRSPVPLPFDRLSEVTVWRR